jgi:predicted  nucleic acid-binding Zn-ribbon protein
MQFDRSMKSYVHDVVRRLLELHALEERLATFKRSRENTSDVKALIDSLRANISLPVLIDHDRLRARGKRSVAEVRHGVCSGCHLGLAVGNVNALKTDVLRRCGNCGRYLYFVEEESEPAPPPVPAKTHHKTRKKSPATHGAK